MLIEHARRNALFVGLAVLLLVGTADAAALVIQGYGASTTGGNPANVFHVTNLNDSGKGSLRDAASASGRTVVFDVSGTITIKSALALHSDLTVDGTTAPAPAITLTGHTVSVSRCHNIILRNLRFRQGPNGRARKCSLTGMDCYDIVVDHCSIEWGRWDCMEFTGNSHDITVQWCIIGEGIGPQRFGFLLNGEDKISVHHNLFVSNQSRNPKLKANAQYINNVVYNWGGGGGLVGGHSADVWHSDVISNYFIAGPSSSGHWLSQCNSNDIWYVSGNYKDLNRNGALDGVLASNSDFASQGVSLRSEPCHHPRVPIAVDAEQKCVELAISGAMGCQPNDDVDKGLAGSLGSYGRQGQLAKP